MLVCRTPPRYPPTCRASRKRSSIGDFSAVITGLLLGLTLPPALPLWMGALGAFIAIGPGKMVFGGLGFNVFNPALVGRAFLQAAFDRRHGLREAAFVSRQARGEQSRLVVQR